MAVMMPKLAPSLLGPRNSPAHLNRPPYADPLRDISPSTNAILRRLTFFPLHEAGFGIAIAGPKDHQDILLVANGTQITTR